MLKAIYVPNDDYFVSVGLYEQIEKLVRLLLCTSENCSRKFHEGLIYAIDKGLGCAPRMGPKGFYRYMTTGSLLLTRHGNGRNAAVSSAVTYLLTYSMVQSPS